MNKVRMSALSTYCSIKPLKKNGKPHLMGTAMLRDAHFDEVAMVGELVHEASETLEPSHPALIKRLTEVRYDGIGGRWLTVADAPSMVIDVTDGEFSVAYSYNGKIMVVI